MPKPQPTLKNQILLAWDELNIACQRVEMALPQTMSERINALHRERNKFRDLLHKYFIGGA